MPIDPLFTDLSLHYGTRPFLISCVATIALWWCTFGYSESGSKGQAASPVCVLMVPNRAAQSGQMVHGFNSATLCYSEIDHENAPWECIYLKITYCLVSPVKILIYIFDSSGSTGTAMKWDLFHDTAAHH